MWIVRVALDRPYTSIEGRAERVPVKLCRDYGRSVEVVTCSPPTR
jgi:hypothetical protein